MLNLILQSRKLLAPGYREAVWQGRDLNPDLLVCICIAVWAVGAGWGGEAGRGVGF